MAPTPIALCRYLQHLPDPRIDRCKPIFPRWRASEVSAMMPPTEASPSSKR